MSALRLGFGDHGVLFTQCLSVGILYRVLDDCEY